MPVVDHPVHEMTKQAAGHPYGCSNRKPFANGYYTINRIYRPDGAFYTVNTFIPYDMSRDCKYDMSDTDIQCAGCCWRKGACDE